MGGLSIVVGSIASASAVSAVLLRHHLPTPALIVLGHAAVTGLFISISASDFLSDRTAGLLGKDRLTGKFVPGSRLAAWPFHLLLNLRINARRARSSEPLVQRVQDGWYISGWPHRADVLPEEKELAVIDCTSEYPRCHDRPYLCLPTWDTQGVSVKNVARGVDFALEQRRLGRAVLVHCAHGHGRSAQVLLAAMIAAGVYKTHQEGLRALQAKRPKCKLNRAQRNNLEAYLSKAGLLTS